MRVRLWWIAEPKDAPGSSLGLWVPPVVSLALNSWHCSFWWGKIMQFLVHCSSPWTAVLHPESIYFNIFETCSSFLLFRWNQQFPAILHYLSPIVRILLWPGFQGGIHWCCDVPALLSQCFVNPLSMNSLLSWFIFPFTCTSPSLHVCTHPTENHVLITCIPWIYQLSVQIEEYLQLN